MAAIRPAGSSPSPLGSRHLNDGNFTALFPLNDVDPSPVTFPLNDVDPSPMTFGDRTDDDDREKNGGAIENTHRSDFNPWSSRMNDLGSLLLPSPKPRRYPLCEPPSLGKTTRQLAVRFKARLIICFLTSSGNRSVNRSVFSPGVTSE